MTKNPCKASQWRAREIGADGAGYAAAQEAEREDRMEAESGELLAPKRWGRIAAEDLDHARVPMHRVYRTVSGERTLESPHAGSA